jgi:TolB protein
MTQRSRSGMVLLILGCLLLGPQFAAAQDKADPYDYIDISNPFLRKIPLAVPLFKSAGGSPSEAQLARSSADLLASSLEFTGYFKLLDRGAFLFDPAKDGILAPQINFANWTVIGAELLVTGLFEQREEKIAVELRLFDTFKGQRVLGKKYAGRTSDQRKIIHRF